MKKSIETPEMKVTIRLDKPDNSLTPKQQEEFEAQVSQADPLRVLEIVRRTVTTLPTRAADGDTDQRRNNP